MPDRVRTSPPAARDRTPTLRHERRLLREGHLLVAGMDEVGRGALAGPVSVGVVVVDASVRTAPAGVKDSKLLTPSARVALVPRLRRWAVAWAVGHAEPDEIDSYGIIAALRLAGRRAMATLPEMPTCVLLDGKHDWFSPPRPRRGQAASGAPGGHLPGPDEPALFDLPIDPSTPPAPIGTAPPTVPPLVPAVVDLTGVPEGRQAPPMVPLALEPQVLTMIKADLRCAAVAAASVLAKVERDSIMVQRAAGFPAYRWQENKGYSAPDHLAALRAEGPCAQHRRTWSLPGVEGPALIDLADLADVAAGPEPAGPDPADPTEDHPAEDHPDAAGEVSADDAAFEGARS